LTMGAIHHGNRTLVLHARLRYFDPTTRRPGLPEDVAALVEKLTADSTTVTLVNVNPVESRRVVVQGGAYGEHEFTTVTAGSAKSEVHGTKFTVELAPGCGAKLELGAKRYQHRPVLAFPW